MITPPPPFSILCRFLLFFAGLWAAQVAAIAQSPLVILDPGHGGKDPGATYGLHEKAMNMQLALALEHHLHNLDINTAFTRDSDVFVSLTERAQYASKFSGPKLFVSLHYNAHPREAANGVETFYHSMASQSLASRIQQSLVQSTRAFDRGIQLRKNLTVLKKNTAPIAVLVEGGFLSNRTENARIAQPGYQNLQAFAIAQAIAEYLGQPTRTVLAQTYAPAPPRPVLQVTSMRPRASIPFFRPQPVVYYQR